MSTTALADETKAAANYGAPVTTTGPPKKTGSGKAAAMERQMSWLQKLRRDGCVPLQTVGFATGAALTIIACLTFAAKLLDLNVVGAINQVWLAIFGIVICLLETSSFNNFMSKRVSRWLNVCQCEMRMMR